MIEKFSNVNFSPADLNIINLYIPLANWFSKLSFSITYFELHELHFVSYFNDYPVTSKELHTGAHDDLLVLEKMVTSAMAWIKSDNYPEKEKAINAALAINNIYEQFKDKLSEAGIKNFKIDVSDLKIDGEFYSPKMRELEIEYLESKKQAMTGEFEEVEKRLAELNGQKNKK